MQHGVKRVGQSKEATEAKKQREQAKIEGYLALTGDVLSRVRWINSFNRCYVDLLDGVQKKNGDWSKGAFDLTTQLLQVNPEFYTIWNYRRNIMLNGLFPARCDPSRHL